MATDVTRDEEPEFVSGQKYKVAYRPTRYAAYHNTFDTVLDCPNCKCILWIYYDRTGTKKLGKDQMKLKCSSCGQWFIANKNEISRTLG